MRFLLGTAFLEGTGKCGQNIAPAWTSARERACCTAIRRVISVKGYAGPIFGSVLICRQEVNDQTGHQGYRENNPCSLEVSGLAPVRLLAFDIRIDKQGYHEHSDDDKSEGRNHFESLS